MSRGAGHVTINSMKVILLQDVPKLGQKNDVKSVASGYARNFLITNGRAVMATKDALKSLETKRRKDDVARSKIVEEAQKMLASLKGEIITLDVKAAPEGHLFAAVHEDDIAKAILEQKKLEVKPEWIVLPEPIKSTGDHKIKLEIGESKVSFTLRVQS